MSFESKSSSLHLETAEETEKRIEGLTPPASPVEEVAPSAEGVGNAQAIETQRVAEQSEAAKLLKQMHENAGSKEEVGAVASNMESRQERTVTPEKAPSSEQLAQQEMQKLYESLDLASGDKNVFDSRKSVEANSGESIQSKLSVGLAAEQSYDDQKRGKFFKGALLTAGAGTAVGIGGMTFLGVGTAAFGFATGGLSLAAGGLGWAGMKAFHAWKERKHEKAFDTLKYGY